MTTLTSDKFVPSIEERMNLCYRPIIPDQHFGIAKLSKWDGMIVIPWCSVRPFVIMRRGLSISLILLLWLPALAALMPGSENLRLPFCCRRQGAHHCAMDCCAERRFRDQSSARLRSCPQFPAALPATVARVFVSTAAPAHWPALVSGVYAPVAEREAARAGRLRAQLDRGPPFSALA